MNCISTVSTAHICITEIKVRIGALMLDDFIQLVGYSIVASATRDMQSQFVVMAQGPQAQVF